MNSEFTTNLLNKSSKLEISDLEFQNFSKQKSNHQKSINSYYNDTRVKDNIHDTSQDETFSKDNQSEINKSNSNIINKQKIENRFLQDDLNESRNNS